MYLRYKYVSGWHTMDFKLTSDNRISGNIDNFGVHIYRKLTHSSMRTINNINTIGNIVP